MSSSAVLQKPLCRRQDLDKPRHRSQHDARDPQQSLTNMPIQPASRQVDDSLIALTQSRATREHQQLLLSAAQDAARLSEIRYRGGATSYLEVLTSETNYFAAQLNLARAQLQERLALIEIYSALGGGWEQ